jgi:hypothetical protein
MAKWIEDEESGIKMSLRYGEPIYYCSECKNEAYCDTNYGQQLFDYCPYCGANMRRQKDE